MGLDKNWAGDLEMQLASYIFNINIAIYRSNFNLYNDSHLYEDEEQYEYINFLSNNEDENLEYPLMVINYINNNHYELLYFKDKSKNKDTIIIKNKIYYINIMKYKKKIFKFIE